MPKPLPHSNEQPSDVLNARVLYRANPIDRITLIRAGLPALHINKVAQVLQISPETLCQILKLSSASVNRKINTGKTLSIAESEQLLGIILLLGQAQEIMADAGDPAVSFDAGAWLSTWLQQPLLALSNYTAGDYMDTAEGRQLVSRLLAQNVAGSYV